MNNEYCIIYGSTDNNPGMFVIAVSRDQELINGFREEHYHFAKYGEVVNDGRYEDYCVDYEISYKAGHYLTPMMITEFLDYMTSIYNQLTMILDVYERNIECLKFNKNDEDVVFDGFGTFHQHLESIAPIEYSDIVDDYGQILNVEICLDNFMSIYEPKPM